MLVSAILPTRARSYFAHRALDCVMRQKWPELEVVILDDLDDLSFPVAPSFDGVHYHVSEQRLKTGEKRNRCCELANGQIIAHFDDDDYSAPGRIEDQMDRLMSTGAMLTGYNQMVFEEDTGECWQFTSRDPRFAIGTSMMYRREFWQRHPFRPLLAGEDSIFLGHAQRENSVVCAPAGQMMLARIHAGNTVTKRPDARSGWQRIERKAS